MTHSRNKGAAGEREFAALLREMGWEGAQRGQQRSGLEQADVVGLPGVHPEIKRVENLRLWAALDQAARDAPESQLPVVFTRRSRRPWVAILDAKAFLELWRLAHHPLLQ